MKTFVVMLGLSAMLLISATCAAQSKSRILIYRHDAHGPFGTGPRLYIYDSGSKKYRAIHKFRHRGFFVYKAPNMNGQYKFGNSIYFTKFRVTGLAGSTTIVQLNVTFAWRGSIRAREIRSEEFKEDYDHHKWLRKKLAKAGYKTVDDVIKTPG